MVEGYFNVQSDNGSITEAHALRQWSAKYMRSLEDIKDPRVGMRLAALLSSAGLVDVETRMIPLPLSGWSNSECVLSESNVANDLMEIDPMIRELGVMNQDNARGLLESMAIYPLMERIHLSREEFRTLVARAREEAGNLSLKAYFPL